MLKNNKHRFQISSLGFIAILSLGILGVQNFVFWQKVWVLSQNAHIPNLLIKSITLFFTLFSIGFLVFSLICFGFISKFIAVIIIIINSICLYFMINYGIMIDYSMLINVLRTDYKEASDLMHWKLFVYVFILGILPSIVIAKTDIIYQKIVKEVTARLKIMLLLLLTLICVILLQYAGFIGFVREARSMSRYLVPYNYIKSTIEMLQSFQLNNIEPINPAKDMILNHDSKDVLMIVIIGEAARKANSSLYGYKRNTMPLLKGENIVILNNPVSCGTATAFSVPCMFSHHGRGRFFDEKEKYDFLPKMLKDTGIGVAYYTNNSGGNQGILSNDLSSARNMYPEHCKDNECIDDVLLEDLKKDVSANYSGLILLHQNGSHGPLYYKRYPKEFEKFKPTCQSANFDECSREEITNAYDNTILYTDYIIAQVINLAKKSKKPTVVVYVSDHGESLGEMGIYLHGFPYAIAPKEQKEIPFIVWMSDSFKKLRKIDNHCLNHKHSYSHDNLFHSIIGTFKIKTSLYNHQLDIFAEGCNSEKT